LLGDCRCRHAQFLSNACAGAPAFIQAEQGTLDAHTEAQLGDAALQLHKEGFRKADYVGEGRYVVVLECSRAKGQPSFFPSREMNVFSIRPQFDGAIKIGASRPDATAPCQLTGTRAKIEGALTVTVDRRVALIQHNAQSKMLGRGALDEYRWRIKSPDADPLIIVRPRQ